MAAPPPAFHLLEIHATGSFGTVCVAEDLRTGRIVALKVIKSQHMTRPRILARARDEARIMMELDHPGIARVHELTHIDDRPIVVMEWVRGASLSRMMRVHRRGVPALVALDLVRQACAALHAAWEARPRAGGPPMRIIHRDIKPSNLLVSVDGALKLVDFGIAKAHLSKKEAETLSMVLGARGYLAPERLDGDPDTPATDVYALGVVLYELLCGGRVEMSLHPRVHAESVDQAVGFLKSSDLGADGLLAVRELVAAMCAYRASDRPPHDEVVGRIDAIVGEVDVEVGAWAQANVWPEFLARPVAPPDGHPAWEDLHFLDEHAYANGRTVPPDVDVTVTRFMEQSDWLERRTELDRILLMNPHWTAEPFLAVLRRGRRSWWRFWEGATGSRAEAVTILGLLRERAFDPDVRAQAEALVRHEDPEIAQAARTLAAEASTLAGEG